MASAGTRSSAYPPPPRPQAPQFWSFQDRLLGRRAPAHRAGAAERTPRLLAAQPEDLPDRGRQYWRVGPGGALTRTPATARPGRPSGRARRFGPDDIASAAGQENSAPGPGDAGPGGRGVVGPADPGVGEKRCGERGVWRVGRRWFSPQTSPSPQVTPTSSRASTIEALPQRAASKPRAGLPQPRGPSSWTAP